MRGRAKKSKPSPNAANSAQRVLFPSPARDEENAETQPNVFEQERVDVEDYKSSSSLSRS